MFSDPWLLALAVLLLPAVFMRWFGPRGRGRALPFAPFQWLPAVETWEWAAASTVGLRFLALCCLILIAAGMGGRDERPLPVPARSATVIVLDVSSSMTADDFAPTNRLEEARRHLKDFVTSQKGVDMGLIVFSALPRLLVPVTPETVAVSEALPQIQAASFEEDGTAIGSAIASAVNRLRGGPWQERRILLITDGVSNRGALSPLDAAKLARLFNVRIDAVGIGTDAVSRFWVPAASGTQIRAEARINIDFKVLDTLAAETGGTSRRVRDSADLGRALSVLSETRRRPGSPGVVKRAGTQAGILALAALCLLVVEFVLSRFVVSVLPE